MKKTAEEVVEAVLRKHEEARDSQQMMFFYVIKEVMGVPLGEKEKQKFREFFKLTSLVRAMRHIQNDKGILPPSDPVKEARRRKAEEMRDNPDKGYKETKDIGQSSLDLFGSFEDEEKSSEDSLVKF